MSISARAVAVQGVGFGVVLVAAQGLLGVSEITPEISSGGGAYKVRLRIADPNRRVLRDDREVLELMPIIVGIINASR